MLMAKAGLGNWADRVTGEGGMGKGKKTEKKGESGTEEKGKDRVALHTFLSFSLFRLFLDKLSQNIIRNLLCILSGTFSSRLISRHMLARP
jgi:hypothetical protein